MPRKDIDELDFTPVWDVSRVQTPIISNDEVDYLQDYLGKWNSLTWSSHPAKDYCNKVELYYDRFGAHMPAPIRKALLLELRNAHAKTVWT